MKTNMQNKGFTLIELLVVIVIIGILATISVATFSGYFAKARDTERQTFTAAARTAILAEEVGSTSTDYCLGGTDLAEAETAAQAAFIKQGIAMPRLVGSAPTAYLVLNTNCSTDAASFAIVVCGEEEAATQFRAGPLAASDGVCASGTYTAATAGENIVAISY